MKRNRKMRIDQVSTSVELPILYPNGEIKDPLKDNDWTHGTETGIVLKVTSMETSAVRAASLQAHKETLGRKDQDNVDFETIEKANAKIYATCIVGWTGVENADGPVEYSPEKALELMLKPDLKFMHEQVEQFVSQRARFFRGSGGSPAKDGSKPRKE